MKHYPFKLKFRLFILFMVAYGIFYTFPNMYAGWPPQELPQLLIDRATPLIPWTFLIYTSDYTLILFAILLINETEHFYPFARAMFLTLIFCGLFFLFFPTIYPRPIYPEVSNPLVAAAMNLIYLVDSPKNCFPSMHVALTSVATLSLRYRGKKVFGFFALWTFAIIVSTLTTKQHYFVDILGGLMIVAAVFLVERRVFEKGLLHNTWVHSVSSYLGFIV